VKGKIACDEAVERWKPTTERIVDATWGKITRRWRIANSTRRHVHINLLGNILRFNFTHNLPVY